MVEATSAGPARKPTGKSGRGLGARAAVGALTMAAFLVAVFALVRYGPMTSTGRRLIESAVGGQSIGQLGRLGIEGLRGDLWGDFSIDRLTLTDRDGVWLDARGLSLRWDPAALLERRVHMRAVRARLVTVLHRPALSPPSRGGPSPVAIDLDDLALRLQLMPGFSQVHGLYDLRAALALERDNALRGRLQAISDTHAGDFLYAVFRMGHRGAFNVSMDGLEARGGALAGAAGMAPDQPFSLTVRAVGDAASGRFGVLARVGAVTPIQASGAWNGAGGSASGAVLLTASRLLDPYAKMAGPIVRFQIFGRRTTAGGVDFDLSARTDNITVAARGEADPGRSATGPRGVALDVRIGDPGRIIAFPRMGPARLWGVVTGDGKQWRFNGAQSVEHPSDPLFSLARISGPLRIDGRSGGLAIDVGVDGEGGQGQGLLAALLGVKPSAKARLEVLSDGRLLVRSFNLAGAGLAIDASGDRGLLGGLSFRGVATLSNLVAARPGAAGLVKASWSASQDGAAKPWVFSFDAQGDHVSTGLGAYVDTLLGASPRLIAKGDYMAGALDLASATLAGSAGSVDAAGRIGGDGALRLALGWAARGPLVVGPLQIDGAAKGSGDIGGTIADPRADLIADFASLDLPSLPLTNAHMVLSVLNSPAGATGRLSLAGSSQYGPAKGAASFRVAGDGVDLDAIDIAAAGVSAAGSASLRSGQPATANLTLAIGPGALLSDGHASGRLRIVEAAGGPRADIDLRADNAVLAQGGAAVGTLKLTASGPLDHLPFQVAADGALPRGLWKIAGAGMLTRAGEQRSIGFTGSGRIGRVDIHTLAPALIDFGPRRQSARLRLSVGTGRADIDLAAGEGSMTATAAVSDLNLGVLNDDWIGRVNANLALTGHGAGLDGLLDAKLAGAGGRDLKGAPPADGEIKARLAGGAVTVDASLSNSQGLKATSHLVLAAQASAAPFHIALDTKKAMRGAFSIDGELKPVWDLLMGGDRSLSGRMVASGTLAGSLADPRVLGTAALENGQFRDSGTGLKLAAVSFRATMANNAIDFAQFSAADGAKGTMSGGGRISLLRDGVSSLRLDLAKFRLIDNDLAEATASGRVSVNRAADGHVKLAGDLVIDRALISPTSPVASGVAPMDVVEIHRKTASEDRFATAPSPAAPVALDIRLRSPGGVIVKGRGLNVELSLSARVGGTTAAPTLDGTANVVRGDYNFAGQRFQLDQSGVIHLGATPETIRLDLTATREDPTLTAVIRIQGAAAKPTITLTSTPVLPQDEVLSQVLFGASASQLTALQAAQLASAVSGLATGGGFDVIGGLRNFAHLDRLAIGGSAATGTTVSGGKYLRDNVYLEVIGGNREGAGTQVEWQVRKHVSLVSRVTSQGDSQISVRWRKDY